MFLGDDDEPSSVSGNGVGQPAGQVVMIGTAILVLNDKFKTISALGDDVDATTTGYRNLRFADGDQVQVDLLSEGI